MAALPDDLSMFEAAPDPEQAAVLDPEKKPVHHYYAEAHLLAADLEHPLDEKIKARAQVKLPDDGHYQFKQAEPFRFEGIVSYKSGYTQVAGHPSSKVAGFATLATSVLEGLNILDVITADRVVAQISTVHPLWNKGQVPSVTFLGTRFENLRIGGHEVKVTRNLDILGPRRDDDRSYLEDTEVIDRAKAQYNTIATAKNRPAWVTEEYLKNRPVVNGKAELNCSLVDNVSDAPGDSFGHVIDLPHFGRIYLGELRVEREPGDRSKEINDKYRFHLTMIRLEMGCIAKGSAQAVALDTNGQGGKGSGGH